MFVYVWWSTLCLWRQRNELAPFRSTWKDPRAGNRTRCTAFRNVSPEAVARNDASCREHSRGGSWRCHFWRAGIERVGGGVPGPTGTAPTLRVPLPTVAADWDS